ICAQPFACLPNHIVGKGMFRALRTRYPEANIVAVDYDPGASEVNQLNRIKLMLSTAIERRNDTGDAGAVLQLRASACAGDEGGTAVGEGEGPEPSACGCGGADSSSPCGGASGEEGARRPVELGMPSLPGRRGIALR
ncbi:MAG: hypothetical protein SPF88_08995, partial [Schaalia hyovaginalis]